MGLNKIDNIGKEKYDYLVSKVNEFNKYNIENLTVK